MYWTYTVYLEMPKTFFIAIKKSLGAATPPRDIRGGSRNSGWGGGWNYFLKVMGSWGHLKVLSGSRATSW